MKTDITEFNLPADEWMSVVLLSDIHNRPMEHVIDYLCHNKPDIIAISGDLTDGRIFSFLKKNALCNRQSAIIDHSPDTIALLKGCVGIAPTYLSLGNHERILTKADLKQIRKTGVIILDNKYKRISKHFVIGGLTSAAVTSTRLYRKNHPDWLWIEKNRLPETELELYRNAAMVPVYKWLDDFEKEKGYKILLSHHPEYWAVQEPFLYRRSFQLVCSGHGHGGQIRFFGKSIFVPGQGLFPKYSGGLYSINDNNLVISRGLSNTAQVPRFGNPCEIVRINLYKES